MAAEIIILSMLRAGPVHGYELKRRVQRTTLTTLSNNSLYPILRRFEADGVVTRITESHEGTPDRKVYTLTERGRALFFELISALPARLAGNEEEFLARVSFFHELKPEQRLAILAARAAALEASIGKVSALIADSGSAPNRPWRQLGMQRLLDDLERERRWITELETKARE